MENETKASPIIKVLIFIIVFIATFVEMISIYGIYYPIGSFLMLRPLNNIWSKMHTNEDDPIREFLDDDELYTDRTPLDTIKRRYRDILSLF